MFLVLKSGLRRFIVSTAELKIQPYYLPLGKLYPRA